MKRERGIDSNLDNYHKTARRTYMIVCRWVNYIIMYDESMTIILVYHMINDNISIRSDFLFI